jgi:hypothetical protein
MSKATETYQLTEKAMRYMADAVAMTAEELADIFAVSGAVLQTLNGGSSDYLQRLGNNDAFRDLVLERIVARDNSYQPVSRRPTLNLCDVTSKYTVNRQFDKLDERTVYMVAGDVSAAIKTLFNADKSSDNEQRRQSRNAISHYRDSQALMAMENGQLLPKNASAPALQFILEPDNWKDIKAHIVAEIQNEEAKAGRELAEAEVNNIIGDVSFEISESISPSLTDTRRLNQILDRTLTHEDAELTIYGHLFMGIVDEAAHAERQAQTSHLDDENIENLTSEAHFEYEENLQLSLKSPTQDTRPKPDQEQELVQNKNMIWRAKLDAFANNQPSISRPVPMPYQRVEAAPVVSDWELVKEQFLQNSQEMELTYEREEITPNYQIRPPAPGLG